MTPQPHIVMVSWRGPRHPGAGGAEKYSEHALRGLAKRGARVTWLVPAVRGQPAHERWGMFDVIRAGRGPGHVVAAARFLRRYRASIDLVIDQFNSYPMLTPLTFAGPRLVLMFQRGGEVWFAHLPRPLAAVGNAVELALLFGYRNQRVVTVSEDSARDLRLRGFQDIAVVHISVDRPPSAGEGQPRRRPPRPLFVAVGRLVPSKRYEHVIDAFVTARRELADAHLVLIGRGKGSYVDALTRRCASTEGVRLIVNASEDQKWRLLSEATALLATSVREGWGMMVTEAHAVGTPSIVYDVPGLRESTLHEVNGLVCASEPRHVAAAMARLATDDALWTALSREAHNRARVWTTERLETAFAAVVDEELRRAGRPRLAPVAQLN